MPARIFNDLAEAMSGVRGFRARTAHAEAKREARLAELNSQEYQDRAKYAAILREDHRLAEKVSDAEEHLAKLRGKLSLAQSQAATMSDRAFRTGDIHSDAAMVRRQIDGLPSLIERAERELSDARDALAAHRAHSAPAVEPVPSDPLPEAEPEAVEAKRGPGRPRKAT